MRTPSRRRGGEDVDRPLDISPLWGARVRQYAPPPRVHFVMERRIFPKSAAHGHPSPSLGRIHGRVWEQTHTRSNSFFICSCHYLFFFFFAGKCVMHVPRPGERAEGSVGLLPTKNLRCPPKHLYAGVTGATVHASATPAVPGPHPIMRTPSRRRGGKMLTAPLTFLLFEGRAWDTTRHHLGSIS